MCQYSSNDGNPSRWHYGHFQQLVFSAAGMIMMESTAVSSEGRITLKDLTLKDRENENSLLIFLKYLKSLNNIPIGIQISHSGRKGSAHVPWHYNNRPLDKTENSWQTFAPSSLKRDKNWPIPQILNLEQIYKIKMDFKNAAIRANRIGFDCIEIHMGHGYLLHQFLSPISNIRKDQYGGNLKKRCQLLLEIFTEIRKIWPNDKVLGVRLTGNDWLNSGININDTVWIVKQLKDLGLDYACITSGGIIPKTDLKFSKGYQVHLADIVKNKTGIITRTAGRIKSLNHATEILENERADLVAFGRKFIRQPNWLLREIIKTKKNVKIPDQYSRCFI